MFVVGSFNQLVLIGNFIELCTSKGNGVLRLMNNYVNLLCLISEMVIAR